MGKAINITQKNITYGSTDDKDVIHLIKATRLGVTFHLFITVANKTPFSLAEWAAYLKMSERTMQRHKREKKSFDPIYSDKILQITLVYNLGTEVFGDKEKFNTWLETQNLALGGIKPKELLDNTFGIGLLKDELTRIEHGVLA
jgi:putative toxin-antitoxin system antitoxin component (TIGR02293 family)